MSSHEIHHLLHVYGLIAVFAAVFLQALCLPIPGSTVVIAAAIYAASKHGLPLAAILVTATAGVTLGGLAGFALGRWRGEWALLALARLLRQPSERVHRLRRTLDRHAVIALLAARWFTGTRNLVGIASGASAMSLARFSALTFLSALIWATVTCFEFYFFGGLFIGAPTWVKLVLILASIASSVLIFSLVRRRQRTGRDAPEPAMAADPSIAWSPDD